MQIQLYLSQIIQDPKTYELGKDLYINAIDNINLNDYIKYNIKNNNFTKIYEQKKNEVRALAPQLVLFLRRIYHNHPIMSNQIHHLLNILFQ